MDDEVFDDVVLGEDEAAPSILPPIIEFYTRLFGYVALLAIAYFISTRGASALEEAPKERPVLKKGLMVDEEEEEDEEDEEEEETVEEIDTDEMIKSDGTRNRKAKKAAAPAAKASPFPKGMDPLAYKQPDGEKVSFRDLHAAMLNRYKDKYPEHGPAAARAPVDDDYDDEMKALLREHLGKTS
ncbi:Aste57867_5956 [Aphanomyces stellatus]|uniref:Aste57867_5956 protein n=1 Tax=Aphanomyces stellatus TaxID=120398 RepID=A0A485KEX9_9STRA|nr:hypothetical protein As57867_005942 [Aphanomyces stellatus]VFT82973.1 Aste57867_5956 [Aphanomyces stellatus]